MNGFVPQNKNGNLRVRLACRITNKDSLNGTVKSAEKKRARDRYANNKERVLTINRVSIQNSKEANREYVYKYLSTHPCQDCGQRNPALLTFDHVLGTKRNDISNMVNNRWSLESIQIKISKTQIVCFNCHMMREHRRRGGR